MVLAQSMLNKQVTNARVRLAALVVLVGAAGLAGGCAEIKVAQSEQMIQKGDALLEQNELQSALAEFDAAVQLSPQLAVAHSRKGVVYRRMGDYEQAIDSFAEAVRLEPNSFFDTINLAQLYYYTHRMFDAIEAYLHACDLKPDDFDANLNLGVCYQQVDDPVQAVERFQKRSALHPKSAERAAGFGTPPTFSGSAVRFVMAPDSGREKVLGPRRWGVPFGAGSEVEKIVEEGVALPASAQVKFA